MEIKKKSSRLSKPKKALIVVVVLGILGAVAYLLAGPLNPNNNPTPRAPAGVKLKPATKEEKKESNQRKEEAIKQQEQQTATPLAASGKKQVNVVITHASTDSVNAYVSGVFEEGGTCSAVFTQGGTTVTRSSQGFANVSYTQCAPITPSLPNNGAWSVVVSYSSANAEGKSPAQGF